MLVACEALNSVTQSMSKLGLCKHSYTCSGKFIEEFFSCNKIKSKITKVSSAFKKSPFMMRSRYVNDPWHAYY